MGLIRLLTLPFRLVAITLALVVRAAFGIGFSYIFLRAMHRSGELPPEPLGLAAMGLPDTDYCSRFPGRPHTIVRSIR